MSNLTKVAFYNSTQWKKTRNNYVNRSNRQCEECESKDRITLGREVHHIDFLNQQDYDNFYHRTMDRETFNKLFSFTNLKLLCRYHHDKVHNRLIKKVETKFDSEGRVIIIEKEKEIKKGSD